MSNITIETKVFILQDLTCTDTDRVSVFKGKENKTVRQTLSAHRYVHLKKQIEESYRDQLDEKIGSFLFGLKTREITNYKLFLNKYGDKKYCDFSIDNSLDEKGLYCFCVDNQLKYIGRCQNTYRKRINDGYGHITPQKCYINGQSTNCHINSLINEAITRGLNVQIGLCIMKDNFDIIKEEKRLINLKSPEWNNLLKSNVKSLKKYYYEHC